MDQLDKIRSILVLNSSDKLPQKVHIEKNSEIIDERGRLILEQADRLHDSKNNYVYQFLAFAPAIVLAYVENGIIPFWIVSAYFVAFIAMFIFRQHKIFQYQTTRWLIVKLAIETDKTKYSEELDKLENEISTFKFRTLLF